MLKLGIIGTGWITVQFVEAAEATGEYELTAIYSRHEEAAQSFASKTHQAAIYTDMTAFLASSLDVVYVASPNSLHASQTIAALKAGKHVVCEKPLVTHPSQLKAIQAALDENPHVMVFEAARHIYDPNFKVIADYVQQHQVTGATLAYMKYSSRFDAYLAGKNPNVFSPKFGGGALMDLGVYLVYAALGWFGQPTSATYQAHLLKSGVDGDGVMRFEYPAFGVTLITGKNSNYFAPSELFFGKKTLQLDTPGELNGLKEVGEVTRDLSVPHDDNPMHDEVLYFAHALNTHDRAAFAGKWQLAQQVHQLMGSMRAQTAIHFDDDPE